VIYCTTLLPSPEYPPVFCSLRRSTPWINRTLWGAARMGINLTLRPSINKHRRKMGLPSISDLLDHLLSSRPIVAADAELSTLPSRSALPFDQIPCLHPASTQPRFRAWPPSSITGAPARRPLRGQGLRRSSRRTCSISITGRSASRRSAPDPAREAISAPSRPTQRGDQRHPGNEAVADRAHPLGERLRARMSEDPIGAILG
jgi:hypothetical protein